MSGCFIFTTRRCLYPLSPDLFCLPVNIVFCFTEFSLEQCSIRARRNNAEYRTLEAEYRTLEAVYRILEAEYHTLEAEYRTLEAVYRILEAVYHTPRGYVPYSRG